MNLFECRILVFGCILHFADLHKSFTARLFSCKNSLRFLLVSKNTVAQEDDAGIRTSNVAAIHGPALYERHLADGRADGTQGLAA